MLVNHGTDIGLGPQQTAGLVLEKIAPEFRDVIFGHEITHQMLRVSETQVQRLDAVHEKQHAQSQQNNHQPIGQRLGFRGSGSSLSDNKLRGSGGGDGGRTHLRIFLILLPLRGRGRFNLALTERSGAAGARAVTGAATARKGLGAPAAATLTRV